MNGLTSKRLDNYWIKCNRKKRYSERLVAHVSLFFWNGYRRRFFLCEVLDVIRMSLYCWLGVLFGSAENAYRKAKLSKILGIRKDEIAMNVNELCRYRDKVRCYGDTFTYTVDTPKSYLKNIEVIFGDANLEALDDLECLARVEKVTGVMRM